MQMTKKKRPDYKRCPLPNEWATDSTGYGLLGNYNTTYQSSDFSDEILTVLGLSNLPGRIPMLPAVSWLAGSILALRQHFADSGSIPGS